MDGKHQSHQRLFYRDFASHVARHGLEGCNWRYEAPSSSRHHHWPLSIVGDGCKSWRGSSWRASWVSQCIFFLTFTLMARSYNSRVSRDYCSQGAIAIHRSKIQGIRQYPGQSCSSYLWWPTPQTPALRDSRSTGSRSSTLYLIHSSLTAIQSNRQPRILSNCRNLCISYLKSTPTKQVMHRNYSGSKNCPNVCSFFNDCIVIWCWHNQWLWKFLGNIVHNPSFQEHFKSCDLDKNS